MLRDIKYFITWEIFLNVLQVSKIFYICYTQIYFYRLVLFLNQEECVTYTIKLSSFKIYSDTKLVSSKTDFFNCGIDFQFILQLDKSKQEVINMVLPVLFFYFSFIRINKYFYCSLPTISGTVCMLTQKQLISGSNIYRLYPRYSTDLCFTFATSFYAVLCSEIDKDYHYEFGRYILMSDAYFIYMNDCYLFTIQQR